MIVLSFDLCKRRVWVFDEVYYFEFKDENGVFHEHRHVEAAMVGAFFGARVEAQRGEVAVEDARVVAFVFGEVIFVIPLIGNACGWGP